MRSVLRSRSYGSARVTWLDRDLLDENIDDAVRELGARCPEVLRVVLFGSVAAHRATPGSDVDVVLVVEGSASRFVDRSVPYAPYFETVGVGVDLRVYTAEEERGGDVGLLRTALRTGRVLLDRGR